MAKKNKKNKSILSNNVNIVLPESLSADEMKNILVEAMLEVEERKAEAEQEKIEKELKEWRDSLGVKKYLKGTRFRWFRQTGNNICVFLHLLFLPRKKVQGDRATTALLVSILEAFFWFIKATLLLISIALIAFVVLQDILSFVPNLRWYENVLLVMMAVSSFILSRLFRISGIEISKVDNRTYLFEIFASITSIVSIIITVASIFK